MGEEKIPGDDRVELGQDFLLPTFSRHKIQSSARESTGQHHELVHAKSVNGEPLPVHCDEKSPDEGERVVGVRTQRLQNAHNGLGLILLNERLV